MSKLKKVSSMVFKSPFYEIAFNKYQTIIMLS